jgi:hypothetical protein
MIWGGSHDIARESSFLLPARGAKSSLEENLAEENGLRTTTFRK